MKRHQQPDEQPDVEGHAKRYADSVEDDTEAHARHVALPADSVDDDTEGHAMRPRPRPSEG